MMNSVVSDEDESFRRNSSRTSPAGLFSISKIVSRY